MMNLFHKTVKNIRISDDTDDVTNKNSLDSDCDSNLS